MTERGDDPTFIPAHRRRLGLESFFVRLVATGGIVGIGTALAAILDSQDIAAWIIGLVVAALSVILAAILWSSRTL
ncbi:MAG: hypothetical protein H0U90_09090 [Actinobacteria bacterium]|nr:hypothetical protein [Actinomycetota bacterium]